MNVNWVIAIVMGLVIIGATVERTAKSCNGGLTEKEAQKVKNTIERLDKDVDKLKVRKCSCRKPAASSN